MSKVAKKLLDLKERGFSLQDILLKIIPCLRDNFDEVAWKSLDINYHPPRVERLWSQFGTMRLMIHKIHPVEQPLLTAEHKQALFHPHPWPSAVFIVSGDYEMGIGYGEGTSPPPVAARVTLGPGGYYTMTNKNAWHYVAPKKVPSMSIMLIDSPWEEPHPFYLQDTYEKMKLDALTERNRKVLVAEFQEGLMNIELRAQPR